MKLLLLTKGIKPKGASELNTQTKNSKGGYQMADDIFCTVLHNVCITLYAKPLLVLQLVPVIICFANIRPRQWLRLNNSFNRVNSLFSSARGYWPPHSVLFTSLHSTGGGFTRLVYQKFTQQQFDMR